MIIVLLCFAHLGIQFCFLTFYYIYIYVYIFNSVVIVSGGQQRDSAMHIHVSILH